MQLSPQEQSVVKAVAARRDGLVALTSELVAFDTVTHMAGAPHDGPLAFTVTPTRSFEALVSRLI